MKTFLRLLRFEQRTNGMIASLKFMRVHNPKDFKKNISILLVLVLCLAPTYIGYVFISGSIAAVFGSLAMEQALFTLAFTAFCVIGLVLGSMSMISRLFLSKDNEFFAALPVKPSTVFAAKLTRLYRTQLLFALLFLLPISIGYFVYAMDVLSLLISVVMIVLVPVFPLCVSALISVLIMPLASKVKNRESVAMIVSVIIMLVVVAGQLLLSKNMPDNIDENFLMDLLRNNSDFVQSLSGIFPPAAWMAGATVGINTLLNLLLALASAALAAFLVYFVAGKLYYKGSLAQLESHKGRGKSRGPAGKTSPIISLFKKEWMVILKTPVYAMNTFAGAVILPMMMLIMTLGNQEGGIGQLLKAIGGDFWVIALVLAAFMAFCGGINTGGSTMVTREGKSFFILKLIPVPTKTIVQGKLLCAVSIGFVCTLIPAVAIAFISGNVLATVIGFMLALLLAFADCCICLLFDCYRPKLDWSNPTYAIKQSLNSVMCLLVTIVLLFMLGIAAVLVSIFISTQMAVLLIAVLLLVADVLLYMLTISKGPKFLQKLEG